jgi:probable rRNA maturation factor
MENLRQKIIVDFFVESGYKLNRKKIREAVFRLFEGNPPSTRTEISVAIVGRRKIRELNRRYRNIDDATNVLSFPQLEGKPSVFPADTIVLGDVVVCYPVARDEAAREEMLVDDKLCELVVHGVKHLLGQDHEH